MKPVRTILFTSLLLATVLCAIIYSACQKDQCKNVTCLNLGYCNNGKCTCPVGYEGSRCDTLSRNKFVNTFNGWDSCGSGNSATGQYQIDFLAESFNPPLQMTMRHILNNWDDSAVCTMQSTDSFTFTGSNNSTTYSGWGRLSHDTLKIITTVQIDTINFSCVYTGGI